MTAAAVEARGQADSRFFLALYVLETACAGIALAWYKYHGRFKSLSLEQLTAALVPLVVMLAVAAVILRGFRRADTTARRHMTLVLAANVVSVVCVLVAGELLVRLFTVQTQVGPSFAGTLLLPKRWDLQRARNTALLRDAPPATAYFVPDTLLGWTVGRSRRSKDGIYLSSVEGIRAPRVGMTFADSAVRIRIAAIGDSFTFGLEGPFEDTWEYHLGGALGSDSLVLNFGVDGYGIDQALLRYERDVRPWHPALTILGFIDHDLGRAQSVYTFMTYTNWGYPFSKPRFRVDRRGLELMNSPVVSSQRIIETPAITDLPFLHYEPGFNPDEWESHWFDRSALVRYVVSRFPRWPALTEARWDRDATTLNIALIREVARRVKADGSRLLVLYFPTKGDFEHLDRSEDHSVLDSLRASNIPYFDMSACVRAVGEPNAFIPGRQHYSKAANTAVARCLLPLIRAAK